MMILFRGTSNFSKFDFFSSALTFMKWRLWLFLRVLLPILGIYRSQCFWWVAINFEKFHRLVQNPVKYLRCRVFRKYSGLSPSRLLSISNVSLFRTKSSVPWTFVSSLSYFYLFISNFSASNFSLYRTKILVPCNYFSLHLELFLV